MKQKNSLERAWPASAPDAKPHDAEILYTRAMPRTVDLALLVALGLTLASCKTKAVAPTHEPVTEEEARVLGVKIAAALTGPCNANELVRLIDVEKLATGVAAAKGKDRSFAKGLVKGARETLGVSTCREILADDRATLLRVRKKGDEVVALIRLNGANGFNYHEHFIGKRDGLVRSYDVYIYTTGQLLSELFGELLENLLEGSESAAEIRSVQATINRSQELQAQGETAEARKILDKLPARIRQSKTVMLRDVILASSMAEDDYVAAMEAFQKRFPNDAALDMVSIDAHYLRKEWKETLSVLDRLEARVGTDPVIDSLRGSVEFERKNYDKAATFLRGAIAAEPSLADAHWGLVAVALAQKDHEQVADSLIALGGIAKQIPDLDELLKGPQYDDFRASAAAKRAIESAAGKMKR